MTGAIRRCVLLFARAPAAEARRKRLQSARKVYEFSVERVARAVRGLAGVDLVIAGSGERPVLAPRARMMRQRGRSFAERLHNAFEDVRALGYTEIVTVPQDVPQIDRSILRSAFAALERRSFVLGPSTDGGVYLIGVRRAIDALFDGVRWRTHWVCSDLLARAPDAALLPALPEIDTKRDLAQLKRSTSGDPALRRLIAEIDTTARPPGADASPVTATQQPAPKLIRAPPPSDPSR